MTAFVSCILLGRGTNCHQGASSVLHGCWPELYDVIEDVCTVSVVLSSKHCHFTAEMSDPMSSLSSSIGWSLITFWGYSADDEHHTLFSLLVLQPRIRAEEVYLVLLENGFNLNTYFVLRYCFWVFYLFTCRPHADCCVNACCKPMFQMIESSIVMDSRVGGVLPSILLVRGSSIHSGPLYTA